jgi:hypothetical protein
VTENHRILIIVFCSCGILPWLCPGLAAMMLQSRKLWQAARICLLCAAIMSGVALIALGIYLIWWNIKSIGGRKS